MTGVCHIYMNWKAEDDTPGGCEIYRGNIPLAYLNKHGWKARWFYINQLIGMVMQYGNQYIDYLANEYDIFTFPRLYSRDEESFEKLTSMFAPFRAAGKRIVYEVDDDLTNQHRVVIPGDAMGVAREVDAITVSTPHLGRLMTAETGLETYVVPNMIDPAVWQGNDV